MYLYAPVADNVPVYSGRVSGPYDALSASTVVIVFITLGPRNRKTHKRDGKRLFANSFLLFTILKIAAQAVTDPQKDERFIITI